MKTTPKEIAEFIGSAEICIESTRIFGKEDRLILQVRSWSAIKNIHPHDKDAMDFQDALQIFIADAINEKIERMKKGATT